MPEALLTPPTDATVAPQMSPGDQSQQADPNVDKAVMASMDLFYHPESIAAANQALQAADPAIAAGDLAAALIVQVDEKNGGNLPEGAIVPAGINVLREIMDYAIEAGIHDFSAADEEAAISSLMQKLMVAYNTTEEQYTEFATSAEQDSSQAVKSMASNLASRGA